MRPKQHVALVCLVQGMSPAETARTIGVRPNTITRWLADPKFFDKLSEIQQKVLEVASASLVSKFPEAIQCLYDLMSDANSPPSVRANAAKAIIDRGLRAAELGARLRHQELEWIRDMTLKRGKRRGDSCHTVGWAHRVRP